MSEVAIQQERSKMNDIKEMIFILVDAIGQNGKWVPAELIYTKALEAPELSHLLKHQVRNYLYTLKSEGRLVMKFAHGKFGCQSAARANALGLLKQEDDTAEDPVPNPDPPIIQKGLEQKKRPPMNGDIRKAFKAFLVEFVGSDEITVSTLVAEAVRRNLGTDKAVYSHIHYLRNHGFLVKELRGIVKLVDPNYNQPPAHPEPPDPSPTITPQPPSPENIMKDSKVTWQKALGVIKEMVSYSGSEEFTTGDFVFEGKKRGMGEPRALTMHVNRLLEKGFLVKLRRGHYKLKAEAPASAETPAPEAPASPASTTAVEVEPGSPFKMASHLLRQMNGQRTEVARAIAGARTIADALAKIAPEHWDQAYSLARELASDGE